MSPRRSSVTTRATRVNVRTAGGVCNGTLGELFQGPVTYHGRESIGLISFPVDRYAWAYFAEGDGDPDPVPAMPKAARAARLFLRRYGLRLPPGRWSRHSELDVGAGMASSTADIVATLRTLFQFFGLPYDQEVVTGVLARIERADSVFLDDFALYLSDRHQVVEGLGTSVGFHTCSVVEAGVVDTCAVTPALLRHYRAHRHSYEACLAEMLRGFRTGDAAAVARAATVSAGLSQQVLPKETYEAVAANRAHFGADGVFVAHTGGVIGYLFTRRLARSRMDDLSAFFRELGHQCSFAWGGYGGA
ncbi:hypothetical protein ACFFWE_10910 [Sphaerisporangium melleum]|uniref:GHMP family kinase ATP-binding protein n=1 Tax=Sphaerisporangium melleum TaxID=321316 RepID=UPI00194FB09B|nr:hypothetical protein [Sphaerisporangium melleum]